MDTLHTWFSLPLGFTTLSGTTHQAHHFIHEFTLLLITFSLAATVRSTAKEDTIDRSEPSSNVLSFGGLLEGSFCAPGFEFRAASVDLLPGPRLFGSTCCLVPAF